MRARARYPGAPMTRSLRHCWLVALLAVAGCDRRVEPYVDPANEPPKVDRPVRVPGLESPTPRASMPLGPPPEAQGGERTEGGEPAGGVVEGLGRQRQRRVPAGRSGTRGACSCAARVGVVAGRHTAVGAARLRAWR